MGTFWFNDPTVLESMIVFSLWQNSVSVALMLYFGDFEARAGFHTCYWESRSISGAATDLIIVLFTIVISALNVVPVYVLLSLSANHNELMQKRIKRKMTLHHGDDEHGSGHGGHSHSESSEHKATSEKTKVVPVEEETEEVEGGDGESNSEKNGEELKQWGRA